MIHVIKHDMDPNSNINYSRKIPPLSDHLKYGAARCCPSFTKKDECSEFIFELLEIDWEGAISSQCIFAKKVVSAESIIFAKTSKFETWRYDSIHLNPLITHRRSPSSE